MSFWAVFGRFVGVHFFRGRGPALKKLKEGRAASHLRLGGRLGGAIFGFYRRRVGVFQNLLFSTTQSDRKKSKKESPFFVLHTCEPFLAVARRQQLDLAPGAQRPGLSACILANFGA